MKRKKSRKSLDVNRAAHAVLQQAIKLSEGQMPNLLGRCPKCEAYAICCDNLPQIRYPHRTNVWCAACGYLASTDRILPDRTPAGVTADEHMGTVRWSQNNVPPRQS